MTLILQSCALRLGQVDKRKIVILIAEDEAHIRNALQRNRVSHCVSAGPDPRPDFYSGKYSPTGVGLHRQGQPGDQGARCSYFATENKAGRSYSPDYDNPGTWIYAAVSVDTQSRHLEDDGSDRGLGGSDVILGIEPDHGTAYPR